MKWIFTPCVMYGGQNSNGSPGYYKIDVEKTNEKLNEDHEINEVLLRKDYRKKLNVLFKIAKQVAESSEYFQDNSTSKIGVLKNYYNYHTLGIVSPIYAHTMSNVRPLSSYMEIDENDVILMYLGWGNDMSVGYLTLMHLMQTLDKLGYESKICQVVHSITYCEQGSNHLQMDVKTHSNQDLLNEYKLNKMTEELVVADDIKKNLARKLQEKDEQIRNLKSENKSLIVELIELRNRFEQVLDEPRQCVQKIGTLIDIVQDTQPVSKDPFQTTVGIIENLKVHSGKQDILSPAAKAALGREASFRKTAYGKRIYKVIQNI